MEERTRQLKEKERLATIGETAGMVGHDIRNPLQAMINDVYLLKDELTAMPESKTKAGVVESLGSVEKNIVYVNKIVADLQDYARPIMPEYSTVRLHRLVTKILENISVPLDIQVNVDIEKTLKVETDATLLNRVLYNLVTNAIQAMPKGGKLTLSGCASDDTVLIFVEDTGVGIPDEIKPKLFKPLVTFKSQGQGFGLAVAKRFVELMQGSIDFESWEGKGTKFKIVFPLVRKKGTLPL